MDDTLQIIVNGVRDKSLVIQTSPKAKVGSIKKTIQDRFGVDKKYLNLSHHCCKLDDEKNIGESGIQNNDFIYLSCSMGGGGHLTPLTYLSGLALSLVLLVGKVVLLGLASVVLDEFGEGRWWQQLIYLGGSLFAFSMLAYGTAMGLYVSTHCANPPANLNWSLGWAYSLIPAAVVVFLLLLWRSGVHCYQERVRWYYGLIMGLFSWLLYLWYTLRAKLSPKIIVVPLITVVGACAGYGMGLLTRGGWRSWAVIAFSVGAFYMASYLITYKRLIQDECVTQ